MAAVDVHGCVFTSRRCTLSYIRYAKGAVYIQAWASALLVLTAMGNARASECGTGDESSTLFCFAWEQQLLTIYQLTIYGK